MSETIINYDMKMQKLRRTSHSEQQWFCNLPDLSELNRHFRRTNETWCDAQQDKSLQQCLCACVN